MHFAIRVDASDQIGTGHLMRCLTLADALRRRGAEVDFISRHMPTQLQKMVRDHGHQFTLLAESPSDLMDDLVHSRWLGTSQAMDAQATMDALASQKLDCLIVDHYALDARWESMLRQMCSKIMVIDDLADRLHDCDVLIDQNFYADMDSRYIDKVPSNCRLLLGPPYALLRDEFLQLRGQIALRTGPVKRVLVFLGGVDVDNYTALVIESLANIDHRDLQVDVVIGTQHPARTDIETACIRHGFACHVQTKRMGELMASADLAIGAVGSATWERCAVGLPSIVLVLADNQRNAASDLDAAGILINLGDANKITTEELAHNIVELIQDERKRFDLSKKSMELLTLSKHKNVVEILVNQNA